MGAPLADVLELLPPTRPVSGSPPLGPAQRKGSSTETPFNPPQALTLIHVGLLFFMLANFYIQIVMLKMYAYKSWILLLIPRYIALENFD